MMLPLQPGSTAHLDVRRLIAHDVEHEDIYDDEDEH